MFDIYHALKHLYPTFEDGDAHLDQIDGVVRISRWNEAKLGPQPTIETVLAVKNSDIDTAKKAEDADKLAKKKEISALVSALAVVLNIDAKTLSDAVADEYGKL